MAEDPVALRAFGESLCDGAREILRARFRSIPDYEVKADASPVTVADREVEAYLRERIGEAYPEHGIVGEEQAPTNPDAEWTWVLDPIDGTKNFATGKPIFGTLVSLTRAGRPVLGFLEAPATQERWSGEGTPGSTRFNGAPVRTRPARPLEECVLYSTAPDYFHGAAAEAFARLSQAVRYTLWGTDCYAYGMLARGDIDLVVETGLHDWDWCALEPVVRGAGGVFHDWSGAAPALGGPGEVLATSCEEVAAAARMHLAPPA